MHLTNVIKKPILTEKSYLGFEKGTYAFKVDKKANKTQIKKVFEEIFDVKVESVRTMNYRSKDKRLGKFLGKLPSYKKAIITLKEGQKLDLLTNL